MITAPHFGQRLSSDRIEALHCQQRCLLFPIKLPLVFCAIEVYHESTPMVSCSIFTYGRYNWVDWFASLLPQARQNSLLFKTTVPQAPQNLVEEDPETDTGW